MAHSFKTLLMKAVFGCCNLVMFMCYYRVPDKGDQAFGSVAQGSMCVDTMGNFADGTLGMFPCHHTGGNQV